MLWQHIPSFKFSEMFVKKLVFNTFILQKNSKFTISSAEAEHSTISTWVGVSPYYLQP